MKIAVALSGGVDSATALYLLKRGGHHLFGLFMKNWEEEREGHCIAEKEAADARAVCELLGVPFYTVNFTQEYWDQVFTHFLREMALGYTPNPDILCNREIKFKVLLKKAKELGADCLATGHYCRIYKGTLLKGADRQKDQTYFLYTLKEELLPGILFPVGHLTKRTVRSIAQQGELPLYDKKDSTGICFIGKRNFPSFLASYLPPEPGTIETLDGRVVGEHPGIHYYTIGQRKGLRVGGEGLPWFVAYKNREERKLIVVQGEHHPALFASALLATEPSWVGAPPPLPLKCCGKIRYRQEETPCVVTQEGALLRVDFTVPQRAITPRQSVVFYDGEVCLGGAIIEQALPK